MTQEIWTMSARELDRLAILERVESAGLRQAQAAAEMGVSERHVRRLLQRLRRQGRAALASRRRAAPSNRRLPQRLRRRALSLLRERYPDFGPTLAHEKLHERHRDELGAAFSVETLRQWMIAAGLWQGRRRTPARVHQSRPRRPRFGELVQIDGSPHDWFEGRREPCALIAFIDDATSQVTAWRFFEAETTFAYMQCLQRHLRRYGVPLSLYSDRHGIFRVNAKERWALQEDTQFSRALRQLRIEPICARTPQAKGRVERLFQTLQDRLVKELRLQGIDTLERANDFLETYRESFNRRFAKPPAQAQDAHRPLAHSDRELPRVLSKHHRRTLSKNLVCQFRNALYMVQTRTPSYVMRGARVTLCEAPDGGVTMLYKGREIPYRVYARGEQLPAVAHAKEVAARVDRIVRRQPPPSHPWRRWNPDYLGTGPYAK